jgi:MFS family permease
MPLPLPLLAVVAIVMGFGLGVGQPITMAWLAEASPPGMRGRSISLHLVGNRAGQLIIPSAVGVVPPASAPLECYGLPPGTRQRWPSP